MNIKTETNSFFKKSGFVLDNAYEQYYLNRYIEYYKKNGAEYIRCQDDDLSNLSSFKDLKYLKISADAYNFEALTDLTELSGLEICLSQLNSIPENIKSQIKSLFLHCEDNKIKGLSSFPDLKDLKADGYPGFNNVDLSFCKGLNLHNLYLTSRYIKSLEGIESITSLESLDLSDCNNLVDISALSNLPSLRTLMIMSCKNLRSDFTDFIPLSIEKLEIYFDEASWQVREFETLKFIEKLKNLKEFTTNFKIKKKLLDEIKYNCNMNLYNLKNR